MIRDLTLCFLSVPPFIRRLCCCSHSVPALNVPSTKPVWNTKPPQGRQAATDCSSSTLINPIFRCAKYVFTERVNGSFSAFLHEHWNEKETSRRWEKHVYASQHVNQSHNPEETKLWRTNSQRICSLSVSPTRLTKQTLWLIRHTSPVDSISAITRCEKTMRWKQVWRDEPVISRCSCHNLSMPLLSD